MITWRELCKVKWDKLDRDIKCNCPICDKLMLHDDTNDSFYKIYCNSQCFSIEFNESLYLIRGGVITPKTDFSICMFKKPVYLHEEWVIDYDCIDEKIEYWRKDYRYIAEMLERG